MVPNLQVLATISESFPCWPCVSTGAVFLLLVGLCVVLSKIFPSTGRHLVVELRLLQNPAAANSHPQPKSALVAIVVPLRLSVSPSVLLTS